MTLEAIVVIVRRKLDPVDCHHTDENHLDKGADYADNIKHSHHPHPYHHLYLNVNQRDQSFCSRGDKRRSSP